MATPEARLDGQLKDEVEAYGGLYVRLEPRSGVGIPDRLVILPGGHLWFVELKRDETRRPEKVQQKWGRKLTSLGVNYACIGSMAQFRRLVLASMDGFTEKDAR